MHIMHSNIGHEMCSVILRLHVLTGCNVARKIGTKYGALNANPIDYLKTFVQSKNLCHEEAESYLRNNSSHIELPPTLFSMFEHILRSHFIIHQYLNLLNATEKSNVQEFG